MMYNKRKAAVWNAQNTMCEGCKRFVTDLPESCGIWTGHLPEQQHQHREVGTQSQEAFDMLFDAAAAVSVHLASSNA